MRRSLIVLGFLVLTCAVASLIVAIGATRKRPGAAVVAYLFGPYPNWWRDSSLGPVAPAVASLFGPEAAAAGWPAPPPLPWPVVTQWSDERDFAYRHRNASGGVSPDGASHQMAFEEFGWPFPALDRVQLFWPWDDPKWSTTVRPDSGLRIRWSGLALNSIVLALAIWLVVLGPFHVWAVARRWRRRAGDKCLACGYPLRGAGRCPECGSEVGAREAAKARS